MALLLTRGTLSIRYVSTGHRVAQFTFSEAPTQIAFLLVAGSTTIRHVSTGQRVAWHGTSVPDTVRQYGTARAPTLWYPDSPSFPPANTRRYSGSSIRTVSTGRGLGAWRSLCLGAYRSSVAICA
eukprot:3260292-Rhodomonas_salina.3